VKFLAVFTEASREIRVIPLREIRVKSVPFFQFPLETIETNLVFDLLIFTTLVFVILTWIHGSGTNSKT